MMKRNPFHLTERGVGAVLALGFFVAGIAIATGSLWSIGIAMVSLFSSVAVADNYYQPRSKK